MVLEEGSGMAARHLKARYSPYMMVDGGRRCMKQCNAGRCDGPTGPLRHFGAKLSGFAQPYDSWH